MKNNKYLHFSFPNMGYALIGLTLFLMAFSVAPVPAVTNRAAGAAVADIKVLGTSNVHDWTMEDKNVNCTVKFTHASGKASVPDGLEEFGFTFPVHRLKSGKSSMDSRAYDAMNAKKSGNIVFSASSSTVTPGSGSKFTVKSDGNLTIAGVTKPVVLTAACEVKADGSISCKGTDKLKMSDYQIKPPSYMLGMMKTGNALTIDFSMTVKQ